MDRKEYRKEMGARLRERRLAKGLTAYRAAKDGGIDIKQVKAVETGATNYTIDILLGYCEGCGLKLSITD